jgi:hypothetical protein
MGFAGGAYWDAGGACSGGGGLRSAMNPASIQ